MGQKNNLEASVGGIVRSIITSPKMRTVTVGFVCMILGYWIGQNDERQKQSKAAGELPTNSFEMIHNLQELILLLAQPTTNFSSWNCQNRDESSIKAIKHLFKRYETPDFLLSILNRFKEQLVVQQKTKPSDDPQDYDKTRSDYYRNYHKVALDLAVLAYKVGQAACSIRKDHHPFATRKQSVEARERFSASGEALKSVLDATNLLVRVIAYPGPSEKALKQAYAKLEAHKTTLGIRY